MAEVVVGAVASGITIGALAAEITSSVVKLKSYWDRVHDAPQDIQDLKEEIDILRHLLTTIEDNQRLNTASNRILDTSSISNYLLLCRKELARLEELTESLITHLVASSKWKRKWASTKVVVKKEKIQDYRARLERAINLLSLSQQAYCMSLLYLQPHSTAAQLLRMINSPTTLKSEGCNLIKVSNGEAYTSERQYPPVAVAKSLTSIEQPWLTHGLFGTIKYSRRRYETNEKWGSDGYGRKEEVVVEYYAPAWLISRAWKFQAVTSCAGWRFCPRAYNIVSEESPIFRYASTGNLEGLQDLFKSQKASPFDQSELGYSALFYSARSGNYAICKLLIDLGAARDETVIGRTYNHTPVEWALWGCADQLFGLESPLDTAPFRKVIILLLQYDLEVCLGIASGTKRSFSFLQKIVDPFYYARPLEARGKIAIKLAYRLNDSSSVRASIALGPLPPLTHTIRNGVGQSLLHAVAWNFGFTSRTIASRDARLFISGLTRYWWWHPSSSLPGWRLLLKDLIAQGSQVHCVARSRTPFLEMIRGLMYTTNTKNEPLPLRVWLNNWLEDLQELGIDLADYGLQETNLHRQGSVSWQWEAREVSKDRHCTSTWTLKLLDYGPAPSDWKITVQRLSGPIARVPMDHVPTRISEDWVEDYPKRQYTKSDSKLLDLVELRNERGPYAIL